MKPGYMHAFISQQHCLSQESHYSREQAREHPSSSKLNLIQPLDIFKMILPSTGQVRQSIQAANESTKGPRILFSENPFSLQRLYLHGLCGSGEDKHI